MSRSHRESPLALTLVLPTDEVPNDRAKDTIRAKCKQYLDRAEKLKEYIAKNDNRKKPVKDGDASSSSSKKDGRWTGERGGCL